MWVKQCHFYNPIGNGLNQPRKKCGLGGWFMGHCFTHISDFIWDIVALNGDHGLAKSGFILGFICNFSGYDGFVHELYI